MSKYIVDIDDFEPHFKVDSIGVFGIGKSLSYSDEDHSWSRIKSIEEFEELNSDYINEHYGSLQDEAYQKGINDGSLDVKQRVEGAYQRGLEDAWEAARKIIVDTAHGGIALCTLGEIFGAQSYTYIMCENTAQEAIDKIKAYDNVTHSDRIEVGDEVIYNGTTKCLVIVPETDKRYASLLDCKGIHYSADHRECKKTGKHYDIASILEAMRQ